MTQEFSPPANETQAASAYNSDVDFRPSFISKSLSDEAFKWLEPWGMYENELENVKSGKVEKISRSMAHIGPTDAPYMYDKYKLPSLTWDFQDYCLSFLDSIRKLIEPIHGVAYNAVLLNRYEDGKDKIGWHSDKEAQIGDEPYICMVNLGATRTFCMKNKVTGENISYSVSHGDVLTMLPNCQRNWLHAVLPEKCSGPRISLTYRKLMI